MAITLRNTKGSALSHTELDANFTTLDEKPDSAAVSGIITATVDSDYVQLRQTSGGGSGLDSAAVLGISLANVVEDTTPQLGGTLQMNGNVVEYTFILNGDGSNYTFTDSGDNFFADAGEADPTLNLRRGEKYRFYNTVSSSHPFEIRQDSAGGSAYNTGVTNNGNTSGDYVEFTPRMTAPDTLYYICTVHAGMNGTINIK